MIEFKASSVLLIELIVLLRKVPALPRVENDLDVYKRYRVSYFVKFGISMSVRCNLGVITNSILQYRYNYDVLLNLTVNTYIIA